MIRELLESFSENRTSEAWTVERIIVCSFREYYLGYGFNTWNQRIILPNMGDFLYYNNKLAVSSINVQPFENTFDNTMYDFGDYTNLTCKITYTYSDRNKDEFRVDQASSWKFKWNTQLIDVDTKFYYDYTDEENPKYLKYATKWAEITPEEGETTRNKTDSPDLPNKISTTIFNISTIASFDNSMNFSRALGSVNNKNFISWIYERRDLAYQAIGRPKAYVNSDILTEEDEGKWLFNSYEIEERGYKTFLYNFEFIYNKDGWNVYEGVTTNQYKTMDLIVLFNAMNKIDAVTYDWRIET